MAQGLFTLKQVNQAVRQGAWTGYIAPTWVEYLVVAGGGGGSANHSGGGGAGGLLTGIVTILAGTSYTVTVGSGGSAGTTGALGASGSNSVFGLLGTTGGGRGAQSGGGGPSGVALSGGSGGGGDGESNNAGASGTSGQGNAGGTGTGSSNNRGAGGGGGAGTVGLNGIQSGSTPGGIGGNGGAGIASAISGSVVTYAGGGGGGAILTASSGGVGGGGAGGVGAIGASGGGNTGGGGGGGGINQNGGSGGSGVVIVRYPGTVQYFTGGTLSYANGYIVHTFYASGTLAPTTPTPYVSADYQISRSLRFNSADTAQISRTPASASNRKTWTWSAWVKRSAISNLGYPLVLPNGNSDSTWSAFAFYTADTFVVEAWTFNYFVSTAVYRDPSAWYHVVVAWDTTQATSTDRLKVYVNGVAATGTYTYPSQNFDGPINSAVLHRAGNFNGYMTEVNFIDGQALTPSSFGYTNPTTGVWSPTKFVGTYGTNGFYLNFSDNSNTTAATLGADYSGNGNNWTPNNFSVTAGAGNDSLVDSPTRYGTDTGVGGEVRGNYATLNSLVPVSTTTILNGNLDMSGYTGSSSTYGTIGITTGKWYFEYVSYKDGMGGVSQTVNGAYYPGQASNAYAWDGWNATKYNNATAVSYGAAVANGDIVGVAFDADAGTLTFYKNGTSQGTAYSSMSSGTYFPIFRNASTGGNVSVNFGQRAFAYTAPSGFKALCTQNLPTPTIGATSTTLAGNYFNPVLYTGNGAVNTVTGMGFQPDMLWNKDRTSTGNNAVNDAVRGINKVLITDLTLAEITGTTYLNSFDANGFTLNTASPAFNYPARSYVAWGWKANGAGSSNTAGSITSTVSANTTSGFSVVTFTGVTGGGTVGHGLGVAPSMIIVKSLNNVVGWVTYHASLGADKYLLLNTTDSVYTNTSTWQNTSPTSTVFSVGDNAFPNGWTEVAYCFAEVAGYSKIGSYTGNGSSDGPFVYLGFRPRYVMVKCSSNAGQEWILIDTSRSTYNSADNYLYANSSAAEGSVSAYFDVLSNGFKPRANYTTSNYSGWTYIYMAFAESPFNYSLAR